MMDVHIGRWHSVELHQVYFATGWPPRLIPQCPDGRPGALYCRDSGSHFQSPVSELEALSAFEAGAGVLRILTITSPIATAGLIASILHTLFPPCDLQDSTDDAGILRLVPLEFLVADESVLELPACRVGCSWLIELIVPYEFHPVVFRNV